MPDEADDDLDALLAQLRAAEANDEPEEVLTAIRKRITIAGNKEATARQALRAQREAEEQAKRGPQPVIGTGAAEPAAMLVFPKSRDEGELPIGATRVGGVPDLPPDIFWPTFEDKKLEFIAQIDLSELPAAHSKLLASEGWLYFFGLFDDEHRPNPTLVFFSDVPRSALKRQDVPGEDEIWRPYIDEPTYELLHLTCHVPVGEEKPIADYGEANCAGWLFGEVEDYFGTPGEFAQYAQAAGEDWINLLCVSSVRTMQWSDCGHLYFLIRRSDLAAREFGKVFSAVCSS